MFFGHSLISNVWFLSFKHFLSVRITQKHLICFRKRGKTWSNSSLGRIKFRSSVYSLQRLSFFEGHLPLKIIFFQWLSSIKGCLSSKVVFNQWSTCQQRSSYHQRLSSINCRTTNVIFNWRLSSINGRLPLKVGFH